MKLKQPAIEMLKISILTSINSPDNGQKPNSKYVEEWKQLSKATQKEFQNV